MIMIHYQVSFGRHYPPVNIAYTVGGVGEHLEGLDGIGLEGAMENEETGEFEVALYLVTCRVVHLWGSKASA